MPVDDRHRPSQIMASDTQQDTPRVGDYLDANCRRDPARDHEGAVWACMRPAWDGRSAHRLVYPTRGTATHPPDETQSSGMVARGC